MCWTRTIRGCRLGSWRVAGDGESVARRLSRGSLLAGTIGLALLVEPPPARAQAIAPSQLTPQSLRPATAANNAGVVLRGPSGSAMPAGAEALTVLIGDVVIEGAFAELAPQTRSLVASLEGKRVSTAQIYALAAALEQAHARTGYVLVRVAVPPQKLVDHGRLRIVIVDGFIEAIDVAALPARVRTVVAARTASLIGRRHVKLAEIERRLLLAADVPGLKLRSTMMRGTEEGGTRIVLEGEQSLVTGSLGTDDRLAPAMGTWQLRGSVAVNDALGHGEQVYGSLGSSGTDLQRAVDGLSPLAVYGAGMVLPLDDNGVTFNPEYTRSLTRTAAAPGVPASLGTFERYALRLSNPLIRTRDETLNLLVAAEYVTQRLAALDFGVDLNRDAYAVVRVGPDFSTTLPQGTSVRLGATLSQGIGGRDQSDAATSGVPLSREGAGPVFTKLATSLRVAQPLLGDLRLEVIGSGQASFGMPMLRSEQFALDGTDALSAFASGTFSVDQGATLRGELTRPFAFTLDAIRSTVSPYVFAAGGRGQLIAPTSVEQAMIDAASLGLGVRAAIDATGRSPATSLGVELARQYSDVPGLQQAWRCNVLGAIAF